MEGVMSWYQFAVFVFAMIVVNVLVQAVIRGFWGHGERGNGNKDSKRYVNHHTFSYKVDDMSKAICSLRQELDEKVNEDVCQARMDKLEVMVVEIRKRLDSIEAKLDKMLNRGG
jgi:uncharacterized protein YceH (UPF0502 family)